MKTPRIIETKITRISKKGSGLGVIEGSSDRIVEVPFTMPGDTVQAALHRKKSGVNTSFLKEIISPAKDRIPPRCVHFATCGGCKWQHIPYEEQLKMKQEQIHTLFSSHLLAHVPIQTIIPSDPFWEYRNKMEFSFSGDATGKKFAGLMIHNSRGKVLNLSECHLANPWFIDALNAARAWWQETDVAPYHPHSDTGALRTLTLRESLSTGDRLIMLTVSGNPDFALKKHQLASFTAFMRDAAEPLKPGSELSIFLRIQQTAKGTPTQFYEILLHGPDHIKETLAIQAKPDEPPQRLHFSISPTAFFQPNTAQAEKLYSKALQLLDIQKGSVVYDLYCGTGTLGICAAKYASQVIGIEISPESSLNARTNAAMNGLKNIAILTGSVRDVVSSIRKEGTYPLPDIVMVDPPRVGLDAETIQHLIDLKPSKILYISCNPSTQKDNVLVLQHAGYQISAIAPVDQFPHTVHIENIVILKLQ